MKKLQVFFMAAILVVAVSFGTASDAAAQFPVFCTVTPTVRLGKDARVESFVSAGCTFDSDCPPGEFCPSSVHSVRPIRLDAWMTPIASLIGYCSGDLCFTGSSTCECGCPPMPLFYGNICIDGLCQGEFVGCLIDEDCDDDQFCNGEDDALEEHVTKARLPVLVISAMKKATNAGMSDKCRL